MMREYAILEDTNYMSSPIIDIIDGIMFNTAWPGVVARKTIAGDFNYNRDIQDFLCSAVLDLPWETINAVIQGLRHQEYCDAQAELVSLIFDRVDVESQYDFLYPDFIDRIEERIILNERSSMTKKIAKMAHALLARMIASDATADDA
ncbi:MAG: hypothetical protein ACOYOS_09180 [Syntrophales bacterium]